MAYFPWFLGGFPVSPPLRWRHSCIFLFRTKIIVNSDVPLIENNIFCLQATCAFGTLVNCYNIALIGRNYILNSGIQFKRITKKHTSWLHNLTNFMWENVFQTLCMLRTMESVPVQLSHPNSLIRSNMVGKKPAPRNGRCFFFFSFCKDYSPRTIGVNVTNVCTIYYMTSILTS